MAAMAGRAAASRLQLGAEEEELEYGYQGDDDDESLTTAQRAASGSCSCSLWRSQADNADVREDDDTAKWTPPRATTPPPTLSQAVHLQLLRLVRDKVDARLRVALVQRYVARKRSDCSAMLA